MPVPASQAGGPGPQGAESSPKGLCLGTGKPEPCRVLPRKQGGHTNMAINFVLLKNLFDFPKETYLYFP